MGDAERRKKRFATGYLMGLSGMPVAATPAQVEHGAVSWLYNRDWMPPLPDYDEEALPHACITISTNTDRITLRIANSPFHVAYRESGTLYGVYCNPEATHHKYYISSDGSSWEYQGLESTSGTGAKMYHKPIWTNTDMNYAVYRTTGVEVTDTPEFGATEPVRSTDLYAYKWMYLYNSFIAPYFGEFTLPDEYQRYIIKTETKYLFIECVSALGGAWITCVGSKAYICNGDWDYIINVFSRDIAGGEWQTVDTDLRDYLGEEIVLNSGNFNYICLKKDIIWSHHDVFYDGYTIGGEVAFAGSERVPVPDPPEADTDNKAIVLGCRLGYIVRQQMSDEMNE